MIRHGTRWLTFECFGTLLDSDHGIRASLDLVLPGRGQDLANSYQRLEPLVQSEQPFRGYREVLAETLRRTAAAAAAPLSEPDLDVLAATIPFWRLHPEAEAALSEVRRRGWRLALLTNCDRELVGSIRRRLPAQFDVTITADDVRAYKPSSAHFERFYDSFVMGNDHWIHVARSRVQDILPAGELGIPRVWINRDGLAADTGTANATLPDLRRLPETVEGLLAAGTIDQR